MAEVTREHRLAAVEALRESRTTLDTWVETGSCGYGVRIHPRLQDVAEAIADARSQASAVVDGLRREVMILESELRQLADPSLRDAPTVASAELELALKTVQFFVDCAIVSGTNPSGAPQALSRIAAALGVKL